MSGVVEHPDHVASPHAFAYVLQHGGFTPDEESRIKFDVDDTKESFIDKYARDLLENVFTQLTTKPENTRMTCMCERGC